MKYKIADLIVEMDPKYENTKKLAAPFAYHGDREADIKLKVSEEYLANLMKKMVEGTDAGQTENFALGNYFNRKAIRFETMLVHSTAEPIYSLPIRASASRITPAFGSKNSATAFT